MMKRNNEFKDVKAKDFVIFKTGTWNGETFTESDLDIMASNFNAEEPPHLIVGHSSDYKGKTMIPSFGRILGGLKRVGSELLAVGAEFSEELAGWIKDGFLQNRSIELSKDNKKIYAVGMLGAMPPAVKGMPLMKLALNESNSFSVNPEMKIIEFAEIKSVDEMEKLGTNDTIKSLSESCARFLKDIEEMLIKGEDGERMIQEVWELQSDLCGIMNLHNQFISKIEKIEESGEGEYSEFGKWVIKTIRNGAKLFNHKRKETNVDAQKEKELTDKIAELETKLKEFSDKESAEKAKAEEAVRIAAETAKAAADKATEDDIKQFCDTAIKENRMTPAMRETDEPIMVTLAKKDMEALKSFQQKFSAPIVPVGITPGFEGKAKDERPEIIRKAEDYAKAHKDDKEFSGLSGSDAINRALYLHSQMKIKFQ